MSDENTNNPPKGHSEQAEKYLNQLIELINSQKLEVFHTDLKKFDPTSLQDHYTVNLKDYQIEISHSKQPDSDKNSYVMIFNNLKLISEGSSDKVILAYIFLSDGQFSKFKMVADRQIAQRRKVEEEKRFNEALMPVDEALQTIASEPETNEEKSDQESKDFREPQIHQI